MTSLEALESLNQTIEKADAGVVRTIRLTFENEPIYLAAVKGKEDGPSLWLEAALHGDECDGTAALMTLMKELPARLKRGRVIVCPVVNPTAFAAGLAASPYDGKNLNRMGKEAGTTWSARYFRWLADLIAGSADMMVDLHGGGAFLDVLSFALIPGEPAAVSEEMQEMCRHLDLDAMALTPQRGELINEMASRGVRAVLLENGGGSALSEAGIDCHLRNCRTIMALLSLTDGDGSKESGDHVTSGNTAGSGGKSPALIRHEYDYYFEQDGVLTTKTPVGTWLKRGDVVYGVTGLNGFEETVFYCPHERAVLLSVHNTARVAKGAYAAYLGTED